MSTEDWAVFLVTSAAIPANLVLILYLFIAPWWRTAFGRAYVADGLSIVALLDLALAIHWTHWPPPRGLVLGLYAFIAAAQWMQLGAFVHYQFRRTPGGAS